uniref:Uncharacterized protein n=1 Tax=Anguilla anguilla TaxID=7936 RepID=A0A0E9WRS6_ANGAN
MSIELAPVFQSFHPSMLNMKSSSPSKSICMATVLQKVFFFFPFNFFNAFCFFSVYILENGAILNHNPFLDYYTIKATIR